MALPRDANRPSSRWTAAALLKGNLAAQCILALLVVAGNLPADILQGFAGSTTRLPTTEVPVSPGDQTRRYNPRRLPPDRPAGPGFPGGDAVPPRLMFTPTPDKGAPAMLLLTGSIVASDARRFGDHLATLPDLPGTIALHSPGDDESKALAIGRSIRAAGLTVVVASGASSFSACPCILAGGTEREVSRDARIGVHQHYFGENSYLPAFLAVSDIQMGQGEVMAYLGEMGVDPMMMAKATFPRSRAGRCD